MLYLDYSRREGEWLPNEHGGRENVEAVEFLRAFNDTVHAESRARSPSAEESTAWPGVSRPVSQGGLGFSFKWNMGWMHDTLLYFSKDPIYRRYHQDSLTFAMIYEYSERFINPLSHDEVVHGKGSLLGKMPGDAWQKLANLRLLLTYMYTRPGKQLLFMGTEIAPDREWNHDRSLDWHLMADPMRAKFSAFLEELGRLYRATPALWRGRSRSGRLRMDRRERRTPIRRQLSPARGGGRVVVVLNLTPTPRPGYRIGAPHAGRWLEVFSSDEQRFGGSDVETVVKVEAEPVAMHGFSAVLAPRAAALGRARAQARVSAPMSAVPVSLRALSERAGILSRYVDNEGTVRETTDEARIRLLACLGFAAGDEEAARRTLDGLAAEETARVVDPVHVCHETDARRIDACGLALVPDNVRYEVVAIDETSGDEHSVRGNARVRPDGAIVGLRGPKLAAGTYRLVLTLDAGGVRKTVEQWRAVAPATCTPLSDKIGRRRAFGIWTNLYAVRGSRGIGVGNLDDLAGLAELAGGAGAAFLGLNPLHALRNRGSRSARTAR
jgi:hypothetical protein